MLENKIMVRCFVMKNFIQMRNLFYLLLIPLLCSFKQTSQPNIIFILADDLGYSDVGYMGKKAGVNTPNIDRLAKNGIVFTNAYAASPVCSPTRASILTGKYPATLQLTCHIPGMGMTKYIDKFNKGQKLMEAEFVDHLPIEEVTFAEVLQNNGYKTAFMGKWHLAGGGSAYSKDGIVNANFHPEKQGFDVNVGGCAYGQPASYFSPYRNATISDGPDNEYLTDRLGDEACQFIEQNKNQPFLLFLSTYTVHTPLQAPMETIDKYSGNKYLAMIEKLDENVGKVLDKVSELELEKNTLIVFYSDNGGVQSNPPLRSNKGSLYEGGIRVPLVVSYLGKIEKGISNVPVTSPDIFPTLLEAAGVSIERYEDVEGKSLWPYLTQKEDFEERPIYWHFPHHRNIEMTMGAAIREGNWKLIWQFENDKLSLYNLKDDIDESKDVSNIYPEKRKRLHKQLKDWQSKINAKMPQPNPSYYSQKE